MKTKTFDAVARFYDIRFFQAYLRRLHERAIECAEPFLRKEARVLDVACGTGNFLHLLSRRFPWTRLYGIDESEAMLARAREKKIPAGFTLGAAERLPYDDDSFDAVFVIEALHHFRGPRGVLSEARRVLRPGGVLLVLDPFADGIRRWYLWLIRQISRIERDAYFFTSKELDMALTEREFSVIASRCYLFSRVVLAR